MALVAFLRGVNVGGHRTFRPSILAQDLRQYKAVSVGAAGTFVIASRVAQTTLRAEMLRRLPFDAELMICDGRDVVRLTSGEPFARQPADPGIVRFVSVLAKRRQPMPALPLSLPASGRWSLRIIDCRDRFLLGLYRRDMKAIGYLGQLEKIFGVSVTTRSWSTMLAIGKILEAQSAK